METESNKAVVQKFWDFITDGKTQQALDLYDDDAAFWVCGSLFLSETTTKEFMGTEVWLKQVPAWFPHGIRFDLKRMIAEGPHVVAEVESFATHKSGRVYNNSYSMYFTIKNGRLVATREYPCTQLGVVMIEEWN